MTKKLDPSNTSGSRALRSFRIAIFVAIVIAVTTVIVVGGDDELRSPAVILILVATAYGIVAGALVLVVFGNLLGWTSVPFSPLAIAITGTVGAAIGIVLLTFGT